MPNPPNLPNPLTFEGLGLCFWEGPLVWGCPSENDFYVSGAIVAGYRARKDMSSPYWIIRPTHYAKPVQGFEKAEPVRFTPGRVPLPRRMAVGS